MTSTITVTVQKFEPTAFYCCMPSAIVGIPGPSSCLPWISWRLMLVLCRRNTQCSNGIAIYSTTSRTGFEIQLWIVLSRETLQYNKWVMHYYTNVQKRDPYMQNLSSKCGTATYLHYCPTVCNAANGFMHFPFRKRLIVLAWYQSCAFRLKKKGPTMRNQSLCPNTR